MFKKYAPLIALIGAGALLFYIKSHQRGPAPEPVHQTVATNPPSNDGPASNPSVGPTPDGDFNRAAKHLIYSRHARCRMDCRHIDENEVKEVLATGKVNEAKIENDDRGKTYPVEGTTHNHHLRIVFAPKDDGDMVVVTCIDLDTEWACDCK